MHDIRDKAAAKTGRFLFGSWWRRIVSGVAFCLMPVAVDQYVWAVPVAILFVIVDAGLVAVMIGLYTMPS